MGKPYYDYDIFKGERVNTKMIREGTASLLAALRRAHPRIVRMLSKKNPVRLKKGTDDGSYTREESQGQGDQDPKGGGSILLPSSYTRLRAKRRS